MLFLHPKLWFSSKNVGNCQMSLDPNPYPEEWTSSKKMTPDCFQCSVPKLHWSWPPVLILFRDHWLTWEDPVSSTLTALDLSQDYKEVNLSIIDVCSRKVFILLYTTEWLRKQNMDRLFGFWKTTENHVEISQSNMPYHTFNSTLP